MVKRLILLLVVLIAALPVLTASAQGGEGDVIYGLISVDRAEVHSGPDFAYPVIGQLPRNTSVTVVGRAGHFYYGWTGLQWIQINYGDRNAWIYARLVRTSVSFNNLPVRGMILPRNRDGRVPDVFDLTTYVCDGWQGEFTRTGDFMAGDTSITVSFPPMTGATVYSVIVFVPVTEFRIAFDTYDTTVTIPLSDLPSLPGTYTWRVVPYWTNAQERYTWQQVCPLRTGGTFDKPETESSVPYEERRNNQGW